MMKLTSWSMGGGERERPESPRGERGGIRGRRSKRTCFRSDRF
uniref:Uncharacterized protein n=1 Tax=Arundo donax TaxID=35708 RepID=A0A0A9G3J6_ARUDO